jgi:hypothetical protein
MTGLAAPLQASFRLVPDWEAISAISNIAVAALALGGIIVSFLVVKRQGQDQAVLEAKKVEQEAILDLLNVIDEPVNACLDFAGAVEVWRLKPHGDKAEIFGRTDAPRHAIGRLSGAMATARALLRHSRARRAPRGITDEPFRELEAALNNCLATNAAMTGKLVNDVMGVSLAKYAAVSTSAAHSNLIVRATCGALIAAMYSGDEWSSLGELRAQIPVDATQVASPSARGHD